MTVSSKPTSMMNRDTRVCFSEKLWNVTMTTSTTATWHIWYCWKDIASVKSMFYSLCLMMLQERILPKLEIALRVQKTYMQNSKLWSTRTKRSSRICCLKSMADVLKCFPIQMDPGPGTVPPQKLEEGELMI